MNTRELINFLEGLAENNNRPWFVMMKPAYDILRAEFIDLVGQVISGTAKFDPPVKGQEAKKALFRINRDIRFSKDKSPYKTSFSAVIAPGGKKDPGSHYYFHIDHQGKLFIAGGCYMPPPDVLAKIRAYIAREPARFDKLLRAKSLWQRYGALQDEGRLARPPKGYSADTPHIDYIRHKSFIVWNEVPIKSLCDAHLAAAIVDGFKATKPLVDWLREAVR